MCVDAAQRWGFPKLAEFLRSFRTEGTTTEGALRAVFEVAPAEFDKHFHPFMRQRFAAYLAAVPTYVITAEYPAFLGVSAILAERLAA